MTLLWKPAGRGNVCGLTPKSEKEENSEDKKSMTEETRSSLTASDGRFISSGMAVRTFQLRGKYRSEQAKYP